MLVELDRTDTIKDKHKAIDAAHRLYIKILDDIGQPKC